MTETIHISEIEYETDNRGLTETILVHENVRITVDPCELFLNAIENNCNDEVYIMFERLVNEVTK